MKEKNRMANKDSGFRRKYTDVSWYYFSPLWYLAEKLLPATGIQTYIYGTINFRDSIYSNTGTSIVQVTGTSNFIGM
jgi:hypothetical protein